MEVNAHSGVHDALGLAAHWHDELIEQTWREFGGKIPRQHIREVVFETTARFAGATVTAFIPILVRRFTRERLKGDTEGSARK